MFRRQSLYIQVFVDHFNARVVGEDIRKQSACHALDNSSADPDFSRVGEALKALVNDLRPHFSLRRPVAVLHFIPAHYRPTDHQLKLFKSTAERSGISFCWLSKWPTPHTDTELANVLRTL